MELARIVGAGWACDGALRLRFADGAEGRVSLAPLEARGGVFATLLKGTLAVSRQGRAVCWDDPDGDEADMDADTLRQMLQPLRAAAE